jgi:acetoin utilization deacetylase AcuC-like enzyme
MLKRYDSTPAGAEGRLESSIDILESTPGYEFVEAREATEEEILLAHTHRLVDNVRRESETSPGGFLLYRMARLAAGGAIMAGEIAVAGNPAFALIRPPGHHASADSYWGFCYHNNIAISLLALRKRGLIDSAFVLDFDLHTGDGNINILEGDKAWTIYNPHGQGDDAYLTDAKRVLDAAPDVDIIVASAGFDQYEDDWGGNISTEGFRRIGKLMHDFAEEHCGGRRFALLEGGYNYQDLGKNILAFCEGLRGK